MVLTVTSTHLDLFVLEKNQPPLTSLKRLIKYILHNHSLTNIDTVIPGYIENLKLFHRVKEIMYKVE